MWNNLNIISYMKFWKIKNFILLCIENENSLFPPLFRFITPNQNPSLNLALFSSLKDWFVPLLWKWITNSKQFNYKERLEHAYPLRLKIALVTLHDLFWESIIYLSLPSWRRIFWITLSEKNGGKPHYSKIVLVSACCCNFSNSLYRLEWYSL